MFIHSLLVVANGLQNRLSQTCDSVHIRWCLAIFTITNHLERCIIAIHEIVGLHYDSEEILNDVGKNNWCKSRTNVNKVETVCIFLLTYCTCCPMSVTYHFITQTPACWSPEMSFTPGMVHIIARHISYNIYVVRRHLTFIKHYP